MTWVFVSLLVVGVLGLLLDVRRHWALLLNADAFARQLLRLIEADHVDRAVKLCNAGGVAWLAVTAKRLLEHDGDRARLERTWERLMVPTVDDRFGRTLRLSLTLHGVSLLAAVTTMATAFPEQPLARWVAALWAGGFVVMALMRLHAEVQRSRSVAALGRVCDALRERGS